MIRPVAIFAAGLFLGLVLGYRVAGSNEELDEHSGTVLLADEPSLLKVAQISQVPGSKDLDGGVSRFSISPELIAKLNVAGADADLRLTSEIRELLTLSDGEVSKLEEAIDAVHAGVQILDLKHRQMIESEDHRMVFEIGEFFNAGGEELERRLQSEMFGVIGSERGEVLWRQLRKSFDYASGRFGRVKRNFKVESLPDREGRVRGQMRFEIQAHKDPDRLDSQMSQDEIEALSIHVGRSVSSREAPALFSHLFSFEGK